MATNHTEKYELNQWLPTDPVIRTDFNADNAKIEAALLAIKSEFARGDLVNMMFNMLSEDIKELQQRVTALEQ